MWRRDGTTPLAEAVKGSSFCAGEAQVSGGLGSRVFRWLQAGLEASKIALPRVGSIRIRFASWTLRWKARAMGS